MTRRHDPELDSLIDRMGCRLTRLDPAEMFGISAWWSVRPDLYELERRQGHHDIPQLRRLGVAAVLLNLPVGMPVPDTSLDSRELRVVNSLPSCVVERSGGSVIRRASPPLTIDCVVMPTLDFRKGLKTVTEFSTYCSTSLVIPAAMELTDIEFAEASFYRVGIFRANTDAVDELMAIEALPPWPETPASWTFAEELWGKVGQSRSTELSPAPA